MKKLTALVLVFAFVLILVGCSERSNSNPMPAANEETWDLIPMVMVDGTLYLDTGYANPTVKKCGTPDGEITSEVAGSEKPTADDQSNFGTGYGYQYGAAEGTIEIYMNEKWRIFATEEVRQKIQFPETDSESESGRPGAEKFIVEIRDRAKEEGLPCDTACEKFYEDENNEYYFHVIKSHYIMVTYNNGDSEDIVTALNTGRAAMTDLDNFGIEYSTEPKNK